MAEFTNPFRPGAGHMPPYLAGRINETQEFRRLLRQETILENMILTGLRGVGKTVLLETLKPIAIAAGWVWVGADLSESASISERSIATRLLADLAIATSQIVIEKHPGQLPLGFISSSGPELHQTLSYESLAALFE